MCKRGRVWVRLGLQTSITATSFGCGGEMMTSMRHATNPWRKFMNYSNNCARIISTRSPPPSLSLWRALFWYAIHSNRTHGSIRWLFSLELSFWLSLNSILFEFLFRIRSLPVIDSVRKTRSHRKCKRNQTKNGENECTETMLGKCTRGPKHTHTPSKCTMDNLSFSTLANRNQVHSYRHPICIV